MTRVLKPLVLLSLIVAVIGVSNAQEQPDRSEHRDPDRFVEIVTEHVCHSNNPDQWWAHPAASDGLRHQSSANGQGHAVFSRYDAEPALTVWFDICEEQPVLPEVTARPGGTIRSVWEESGRWVTLRWVAGSGLSNSVTIYPDGSLWRHGGEQQSMSRNGRYILYWQVGPMIDDPYVVQVDMETRQYVARWRKAW